MKNRLLLLATLGFAATTAAYAQNTFPASGNVGIGTASPLSKLHVNGQTTIQGAVSNGVPNSLVLADSNGQAQIWGLGPDSSTRGTMTLVVGRSDFSNSIQAITIDSSANVGIGASNPGARLEIRNDVRSTQVGDTSWLKINGGGGYTGDMQQIAMGYDGTFSPLYFGTITEDQTQQTTAGFFVATRSSSAGSVRPTEVFRISSSGNVGIGMVNPNTYGAKLGVHVGTDMNFSVRALPDIVGVGTGVGLDSVTDNAGGVAPMGFRATVFQFLTGNVGIGTTAPGAKLSIKGDGTIDPLQLSDGARSFRVGPSVGVSQGFNIYDDNAAAVRLRIDNSGNVGIGTTNPTEKLSVNGRVRAKEVIVDTGWSDYVFEKDYHLASLSEVEQHIQSQGHLPGVPSAQEVAAKGVSLGDMQSILLAKIEELTLHQIAQEKRIQALEAENAQLKAQTK